MKTVKINNTLFLTFYTSNGVYKVFVKASDIVSFETDVDNDKISEIYLSNNRFYTISIKDRLTMGEISTLIDIYNRELECLT